MTVERAAAPRDAGRRRLKGLLALGRLPGVAVIFGSAGSLVGTLTVTSLLGFVYWWIAARLFETTAVGFAAAAVSAMNLLGSLGMLGFGTLLIGELPKHRDREWAFVNAVLLVTGAVGFVLGVAFTFLAPLISGELAPLRAGWISILYFAAGVALTAATNVLDMALIGMLRGSVQLWRNVVFAGSKLAMVAALALAISRSSMTGIYVTWTLGNVLSLGVVGWPLVADRLPLSALRPDFSMLRGLQGSATWHHLQNLALQTATLVLPLIVIATLSAADNAYFYIIWLLAGFVFVPPFAVSIGLYTIGARDPDRFARYVRLSISSALLFGAGATVVTWLSAETILQIFGQAYSTHGALALRVVVLGVFPLIVKDHFVSCCRVQGRTVGPSAVLAAGSLVGLGAAAAGGAMFGLSGIVAGWLVVELLQMLWFAPTVYRAAFPA